VIKTFKETIASLQDKQYGTVIIGKSLKQAVWYWSQYFLLITVITVLLIIAGVTYFIPQLPKLLQKTLPDATYTVSHGKFSTTLKQPVVLGSSDFPIVIDTTSTDSSALAKTTTGVLITSDKIEVKQSTSSSQIQTISDFPDFSFSKNSTVSWISGHQLILWLGVCLGIILISVVISILFWLGRISGFVVWGLIFWLFAKVIKYPLTYQNCLKLVLYASVLPYLMSVFTVLAPSEVLSFLNLAVFLYFGLTWLLTLSKSSKIIEPSVPVTPKIASKSVSKKSKK
jgi:hypothetical protein